MDKVGKYLFDISNAIALIESFLVGVADFQAYQQDIKTQSAVERQLAIIGEVVNKLKQERRNKFASLTNLSFQSDDTFR